MVLLGLCLIACENRSINENQLHKLARSGEVRSPYVDDENPPMYTENDAIILGAQRNNPYEIDNMRTAYGMLSHILGNFIVGAEEPEVNTIYYRVLPSDTSELAVLLADTTIQYFDYPLDYEIEQWGSYYHDPTVADTNFTWLYAVVPVTYSLPNLPSLEILQECYIPNEPTREYSATYDTIPDWKNGYAMLEYVAYRESGNVDMFEEEDAANMENILLHSASWNEYGEPQGRRARSFWTWLRDCITGVHPEGTFTVENTFTHSEEGIKNAKVFIHNFVKIYCGPINSNGYYKSEMRFRTHVWYHIRFDNHHTQTSIYGGKKGLLGPYHKHVGWHSRYGYSCLLQFEDVGWRYATINNAVEQYFSYCQEYNILFPYYMRIWLKDGMEYWSGSTPLFHKRQSILFYNAFTYAFFIPYIIRVPDMILFMSQNDHDYETLSIYDVVFHELAHASHYEKVGNSYWEDYVLHIITNLGYGDDSSGDWAGYCGIGEMWGNFAGSCFLYKYMGYTEPFIYLDSEGRLISSLYSFGVAIPSFLPFEGWFHPGILAKIHEDADCSITDIYNALNADVTSLETLKTSLCLQGIDEGIILNAYDRYNYWEP